MPESDRGFALDLTDLEPVARTQLPGIADQLRRPIRVLNAHEGLEGPGRFPAMYPMEGAYAAFTDMIANRLAVGCARIDETATALRQIIDLYRRADGQG